MEFEKNTLWDKILNHGDTSQYFKSSKKSILEDLSHIWVNKLAQMLTKIWKHEKKVDELSSNFERSWGPYLLMLGSDFWVLNVYLHIVLTSSGRIFQDLTTYLFSERFIVLGPNLFRFKSALWKTNFLVHLKSLTN